MTSVIVTGAARGIGEAIARRLHVDGYTLALADIDLAGAERVAAELGDRARAARGDRQRDRAGRNRRSAGAGRAARPNGGEAAGDPGPTRLGRAEEVAALVSFLVSDEAGYITGATLDVNGGVLMR